MAGDSRNKCPVCQALVGDGAGREPGRRIGNFVPVPDFQNPRGQARAAKLRAKNQKKGK